MQNHETTKEGVFTTILELRENGIFPAEFQDDNKTTKLNSEVKYAEPFDNMYEKKWLACAGPGHQMYLL